MRRRETGSDGLYGISCPDAARTFRFWSFHRSRRASCDSLAYRFFWDFDWDSAHFSHAALCGRAGRFPQQTQMPAALVFAYQTVTWLKRAPPDGGIEALPVHLMHLYIYVTVY